MSRSIRPPGWLIGAVAVATVLSTGLTLLLGPRPPEALRPVSGDPALADRVLTELGQRKGIRAATVASIEDGGAVVRHAGLGQAGGTADQHTRFEIGSVTKGLTGMLLADAAEKGQVSLDAPLDSFEPGLGRATLADLSSHHSGLPRLSSGYGMLARSALAAVTGDNPYSDGPEQVLERARAADAPGGAGFAYSNLGASVLGQVLAQALDTSYPQALRERVLSPLGMNETSVVTRSQDLPADRVAGTSGNGRRQAPWIAAGFAPAGVGVWSTTADLSRLVAGLLRAEAPGASATRPRADADAPGTRIGLGWFSTETDRRTVIWHNGATGGFRSFVGYDPQAGRGIVLLAATDRDLDDTGFALLTEER